MNLDQIPEACLDLIVCNCTKGCRTFVKPPGAHFKQRDVDVNEPICNVWTSANANLKQRRV
jgi:hypothetical protein